jgi:thioesterase domain-containing protein
MKKLIIGSLVGAALLFGWQSLSWTALHIHDDAYLYSSNQDSILATLSRQLPAEGFRPMHPTKQWKKWVNK